MQRLLATNHTGWIALSMAAFIAAILLSPGGLRAGGLETDFVLTLKGQAQIGGATVEVQLFGNYAEAAGAAPCVGGSILAGTVAVTAGETTRTGVFTEGEVTLRCVPSHADALYIDGQGVWEDEGLAPFFIEGLGTQSAGGEVSEMVADITSVGGFNRRGSFTLPFSGRVKLHGDSALGGSGGRVLVPANAISRSSAVAGARPDGVEGKAPTDGRPFSLQVGGPIALGKARIGLSIEGLVRPDGGDCTYAYGYRGNRNGGGGSLTLKDADDEFNGDVFSFGIRACPQKGSEEGAPRSFELSLDGVIKDARSTPFSAFARGLIADGGRITEIEGGLIAFRFDRFYGDPSVQKEDIDVLSARVLTFGGNFTGAGRSKGLGPVDEPDREPRGSIVFKFDLDGSDGAHDVSIDATGIVQGQVPFDRSLFLRFTKATVTVDGKTYALTSRSATLQRNFGGSSTLTIIGALQKPAKPGVAGEVPEEPVPVGVVIARLEVTGLTTLDLQKGGAAEISGRVASLKLKGSRLTPEVAGELTITVKK